MKTLRQVVDPEPCYVEMSWRNLTLGLVASPQGLSRVVLPNQLDGPWRQGKLNADVMAFYVEAFFAYFHGQARWNIPLDVAGTPFQQAVWAALSTIPYGAVITYGDLARRIGRPEAVRAVARAVGDNPVPIVVPCHRVIGANGTLTGYRGGLALKQQLLEGEGVAIRFRV